MKKEHSIQIVDTSRQTELFNHELIQEKIQKTVGDNITLLSPEEDTFESPPQQKQNFDLSYGLDLPSQVKGPFSPIDKQRWIIAIENLLVRGANSAQHIAKLTGLTVNTTSAYIKEIKERWSSNLTIPEVNVRREKLYNENERVSNFCWDKITEDPDGKNVISFLKIIGETNTRKARLIGAEIVSLNVEQANIQKLTQEEMQQQASKQLGIDVASLQQLGDLLALEMSGNTKKKENE